MRKQPCAPRGRMLFKLEGRITEERRIQDAQSKYHKCPFTLKLWVLSHISFIPDRFSFVSIFQGEFLYKETYRLWNWNLFFLLIQYMAACIFLEGRAQAALCPRGSLWYEGSVCSVQSSKSLLILPRMPRCPIALDWPQIFWELKWIQGDIN